MLALAAIINITSGLGYGCPRSSAWSRWGCPHRGRPRSSSPRSWPARASCGSGWSSSSVCRRRSSATTSAISWVGGWGATSWRPRVPSRSTGSSSSPPATASSPSTAPRPCSSRAGLRWCASPPRGWRASTTCASGISSSGTRWVGSPGESPTGSSATTRGAPPPMPSPPSASMPSRGCCVAVHGLPVLRAAQAPQGARDAPGATGRGAREEQRPERGRARVGVSSYESAGSNWSAQEFMQ